MINTTGRTIWKSADFALALFGIATSIAIFLASDAYPDLPWNTGGPPSFFPQVLSVVLAILSLCVLAERWLFTDPDSAPTTGRVRPVLGALAVLAAVPFCLDVAGFRVTGFFLTLSAMLVVGGREAMTRKGFAVMAAVALVATLTLHYAFEDLAGRRLPVGTLFR